MDGSLVFGRNTMDYTIKNTLNRSIGPTSKTVFDSGGFDYDQIGAQPVGRPQDRCSARSPRR